MILSKYVIVSACTCYFLESKVEHNLDYVVFAMERKSKLIIIQQAVGVISAFYVSGMECDLQHKLAAVQG